MQNVINKSFISYHELHMLNMTFSLYSN